MVEDALDRFAPPRRGALGAAGRIGETPGGGAGDLNQRCRMTHEQEVMASFVSVVLDAWKMLVFLWHEPPRDGGPTRRSSSFSFSDTIATLGVLCVGGPSLI